MLVCYKLRHTQVVTYIVLTVVTLYCFACFPHSYFPLFYCITNVFPVFYTINMISYVIKLIWSCLQWQRNFSKLKTFFRDLTETFTAVPQLARVCINTACTKTSTAVRLLTIPNTEPKNRMRSKNYIILSVQQATHALISAQNKNLEVRIYNPCRERQGQYCRNIMSAGIIDNGI